MSVSQKLHCIFQLLSCAVLAGIVGAQNAHATQVTIDFSPFSTPATGQVVEDYLASYGITYSTSYSGIDTYAGPIGPGSAPFPNNFTAHGLPGYFDYRFTFATDINSFSFVIPSLAGYSTQAAWSATAFAIDGSVLASAGDPNIEFDPGQRDITLNGPDIAYIQFSSDAKYFAGNNLNLDDIVMDVPAPMPEASSVTLLSMGIGTLVALTRWRKKSIAAASSFRPRISRG